MKGKTRVVEYYTDDNGIITYLVTRGGVDIGMLQNYTKENWHWRALGPIPDVVEGGKREVLKAVRYEGQRSCNRAERALLEMLDEKSVSLPEVPIKELVLMRDLAWLVVINFRTPSRMRLAMCQQAIDLEEHIQTAIASRDVMAEVVDGTSPPLPVPVVLVKCTPFHTHALHTHCFT